MILLRDSELENLHTESWHKKAYELFKLKMTDANQLFPCIPALLGLKSGHLRYGFIGSPLKYETSYELAAILKEYSLHFKSFGKYTSLIIFFESPKESLDLGVQEYQELFWQHLINLTRLDELPWPEIIPSNPSHPLWEFCFHGTPYFMYCATPAHINRKSRNFPYLMLAITPRFVLKEFLAKEKQTVKIKQQIRKRLKEYDSIPIHPALNSYGNNDNYEWQQYFLPDDQIIFSQCPFHKEK
ncbi:YqcI/YcgG family protein [Bacillus sp. DTU_2020_1000418_1_SI_GHA_SEK_038]|uniref:YqcI/YcgG family protein n=1 Tax=Bacillus sp. DTU_2020_1000418_1_SI_GHA_SEK_038 TaxID=3077585 RepID=UPI0028E1DAE7|nr:YqcI/YcgG family protein [Bacillus sp. DTU_2020_1000418_1_SI_GHA_SEK_038]WNS73813.1 YqcI/YcgG family protein [Bacillus sp. DTU_2020_1000418_1_SI_GHA_SEK_038]